MAKPQSTSAPMKLFVGNVSLQYHNFDYRLRGRFQLMKLKLAPGQQVMIEHEREDIEQIIAHQRRYGFSEVRDALDDITPGLVFSYQPIAIDRLMEALDRRRDQQGEQMQLQREAGAIASANEAARMGLDIKEVEVIEQPPAGPPQRGARKPLKSTTVIDRAQPEARRVG